MPDADGATEISSIELSSVLPPSGRTPELEPYRPERQRDWVRTIVTVGLLTALGGVIFWACRESVASATQWGQTKEMLQIILPAVTGLLGSVIGFYFGTGSFLNSQKGDS
ncbi:MAG: hypothetical protein ACRYF4_11025 [Janthinobacterium lividum]